MITGDTRDYLFDKILPKNCICAEIGVRTGNNAERILNLSNPKQLYLIDSWDWVISIRNSNSELNNILKEYYKNVNQEEWYKIVKNKFIFNNNVTIIRKLSVDASKDFDDDYFDWVYIDASHDYESIKEDIKLWYSKVKEGGFLCGHDYIDSPNITIDVKKAINEFLVEYNLELYYKSSKEEPGVDGASDWVIKK